MTKQIVEDPIWRQRINSSNKYYEHWEQAFKCEITEKYYEGKQWKDSSDLNYHPYTINKVYETIQIKVDQFIPQFPLYEVSAEPTTSQFNIEAAAASTVLKEGVLNTIVQDNNENFREELEQAYKDSFFRFGLIEVAYAADWILNPNVKKPLLSTDTDINASKQNPKIKREPDELPINERVYFKQIPAKRFRVGGIDHKYLSRCSWCGYYEWVNKTDLLALKGIMNRDKIQNAVGSIPDTQVFDKDNKDRHDGESVKIWHIWDNRSMMRLIILDSPCITIFQRKFVRLPLFDYRPDRRVTEEGFYPIPPTFHWLSPQDEINEVREAFRRHRRRFIRKYQVAEGAISDEELAKWEEGEDGALIKVNQVNAIQPIQDADLGPSADKALVTSSDDLNQISGTGAEVRGVADRTTATQANIINSKSNIRSNAEISRISKWLQKIAREVLLTVRDKFALGVWAKFTTLNKDDLFQEIQENRPAYQWVTSEDLNDGYDFRIRVDVTSLSADTQEKEKQKFLEFLSIVSQFPQIAMSPTLVREAAYRVGYRNEKAIREMQKMALLHQAGVMAQAGVPGQAGQGNPAAQQIVANKTPNSMEKIRNQLTNQLGLVH